MHSTLDGARRAWLRVTRGWPAGAWIQAASRTFLEARNDFPALSRWGMHATVTGLAVAAIVTSQLSGLAGWAGPVSAALPATVADAIAPDRHTSARGSAGFLVRLAPPRTALGEAPAAAPSGQATLAAQQRGTVTYTVQPGDTVLRLAEQFGVTPDTILSANGELAGNPDLLKLGQELVILPESGVLHEVQAGETLSSIAQDHKTDVATIIAYQDNNLVEPYTLEVGQKLFLPGAELQGGLAPRYAAAGAGSSAYAATGRFMWPTTGYLTQYPWAWHVAIDIGTATGTPIYAADSGYVLEAGWSNVGYGLHVVIDHGNGYRTLYGHMSVVIAQAGQSVQKGQLIGRVGSTGNSTGPHLHFEIYLNGALQNPLNYLP